MDLFSSYIPANLLDESEFLLALLFSILTGLIMGVERELRHKDAGMSTHILVISGAMVFTYLSVRVDSESTTRIAAQIVSGIGFLGAGLIIKEGVSVRNLTTAASLWFAAAIGMCFGFGYYFVGAVSAVCAALVPRIPHLTERGMCTTCGQTTVTDEMITSSPESPKEIKKRKKKVV